MLLCTEHTLSPHSVEHSIHDGHGRRSGFCDPGVPCVRRRQDGGKEGGLPRAQLVGVFHEPGPGGFIDSPDVWSEFDHVQVQLQDAVFGHSFFKGQRQQELSELALKRSSAVEEQVLGKLLGNLDLLHRMLMVLLMVIMEVLKEQHRLEVMLIVR